MRPRAELFRGAVRHIRSLEGRATSLVRFGRRRAAYLYWWDVVVSIGPSLWSLVKRLGLFGIVADLYRRARGL